MTGKIVKITAAFVLAVTLNFPMSISAAPFVRVNTKYYEITGTSGKELKDYMKVNGPNGYWAYTTWRVKWTSNCVLSVTLNYTFPKLKNPEKVPLPLRRKFQAMLGKLEAHEERHGQNGIDAATEIKNAKCVKPKKIIRKYSDKDKSYDRETRHGYLEGVRLEN